MQEDGDFCIEQESSFLSVYSIGYILDPTTGAFGLRHFFLL